MDSTIDQAVADDLLRQLTRPNASAGHVCQVLMKLASFANGRKGLVPTCCALCRNAHELLPLLDTVGCRPSAAVTLAYNQFMAAMSDMPATLVWGQASEDPTPDSSDDEPTFYWN